MAAFQSILILAALQQEEDALLARLQTDGLKTKIKETPLSTELGLKMLSVDLPRRSIAIVKTGIGSVNAAVAFLLAHEASRTRPFDAVILLGVGGSLREGLDPGDLVISKKVLQHDYFYSFDPSDRRIRPGALILSSAEAEGHEAEMDADPELVEWMKNAASQPGFSGKVFMGTILSGNEFVGRVERKRNLAALASDAWLVDMEAAGVAQLACRLKIPFVVAKTVADRLNPDGSIESDFRTCLEAACDHAAAALHLMLDA